MAAKLVLVRIDDRFIHGQVAVAWVKAVNAEHIVVADDTVADDSMQKTLQEMATSLKVSICHVREVAAVCDQLAGRRTLVLFGSAQSALEAVKIGLPVTVIDVGNLRFATGKKQIMNAVAINDQDKVHFKALIAQGIKVVIQMVPTDEPVDIGKFLG